MDVVRIDLSGNMPCVYLEVVLCFVDNLLLVLIVDLLAVLLR
jgi:hypothetical protein